MKKFSFYKAPVKNIQPTESTELHELWLLIVGDKYKERTEQLRSIQDKTAARKFKATKFDYVTFSGTFSTRSDSKLINYSGLIVLDFDHLKNVDETATLLLADEFLSTLLLFRSPSGDGLKWVISSDYVIEQTAQGGDFTEHHTTYFSALANYCRTTYGLEIDASGKDISRACFIPHDAQAILLEARETKKFDVAHWAAQTIKKTVKIPKNTKPVPKPGTIDGESNFEKVLALIEQQGVDIAPEYNDWLAVGFALADEFGAGGETYFHRICRLHSEYNESACSKQYGECLKRAKGGTFGAFFSLAKAAGIDIAVNKGRRPDGTPAKSLNKTTTQGATNSSPYVENWLGVSDLKEIFENEETKVPSAIICWSIEERELIEQYGVPAICPKDQSIQTLSEIEIHSLRKYCEKIYHLPNSEENRRIIAEKFIDCHTIILTSSLSEYCEQNTVENPLINLMNVAMPLRFWEWTVDAKKRRKCNINLNYSAYCLAHFGFRQPDEAKDEDREYIRIQENIVTPHSHKELLKFLFDFLCKYSHNIVVREVWAKCPNKKEIANLLPNVSINTVDNTFDSQYFFFKNNAVRITKEKIEDMPHSKVPFLFSSEIMCELNFQRLSPAIWWTHWDAAEAQFDDFGCAPEIKSHYARYLINGSRIHWRKEMEDRATGNEEEDAAYFKANQFTLYGERLTSVEKIDQVLNFFSKCFTLGYLMHRYKSPSKAWAVWAMETREKTPTGKTSESSGGSGKSFMFRALGKLGIKNMETKGGRDRDFLKDKFIFANLNEHTSIFVIDDCHRYVDFDFFYSQITGDLEVRKMHQHTQKIAFTNAPKLVFTSNYTPKALDSSTSRRLQFVIFSDWYHANTAENDYKETRQINSDFGYDIIENPLYKDEWKNEDVNFLFDCLQYYLEVNSHDGKIEPPMNKLFERMNEAKMGDHFAEWAENYFEPVIENPNLNTWIPKAIVRQAYIEESGCREITAKKFGASMVAFCDNKNYQYDSKRQHCKLTGKTNDCYYVGVVFPENTTTENI